MTEGLRRYIHCAPCLGTFVGLTAAPGASGFFRRFGFAERPAERLGIYRVW